MTTSYSLAARSLMQRRVTENCTLSDTGELANHRDFIVRLYQPRCPEIFAYRRLDGEGMTLSLHRLTYIDARPATRAPSLHSP
jgi:hypothetical protein